MHIAEINNTLNSTTKDYKYHALGLLLIPLLTISGNIFVVVSVARTRNLHTITNYFICSLACADFVVATCVMPFGVYVELNGNGEWELGRMLCDVYITLDVFASTASILNLVAICLDRYMAVSRPLVYSRRQGHKHTVLTVIAIWVSSCAIACPILFQVNKRGANAKHCEFVNPLYSLISSIISFWMPAIAMIILYTMIFLTLAERLRNSTKMKTKQIRTSLKNNRIIEKTHKPHAIIIGNQALLSPNNDPADDSATVDNQYDSVVGSSTSNSSDTSPSLTCRSRTASHLNNNSPQRNNVPAVTLNPSPTPSSYFLPLPVTSDNSGAQPSETSFTISHAAYSTSINQLPNTPCPSAQSEHGDSIQTQVHVETALPSASPDNATVAAFKEDELFAKLKLIEQSLPFIDSNSISTASGYTEGHDCYDICQVFDNRAVVGSCTSLTIVGDPSPRLTNKSITMDVIQIDQVVCDQNISSTRPVSTVVFPTRNSVSSQSHLRELARQTSNKHSIIRSISSNCGGIGTFKNIIYSKFEQLRSTRTITPGLETGNNKTSRHPRVQKREHKRETKERKATQTLAIVFAVFIICWTPFFMCHLTNSICMLLSTGESCIDFIPFFIVTWIGYMNSFMNPIIYTIFNPEFRKALKRLVRCQKMR